MFVDLTFLIRAAHPIPADHGYLLYAAVSRALPAIHQGNGYGIHPIGGRRHMGCGVFVPCRR